jgi:hypothetical protein
MNRGSFALVLVLALVGAAFAETGTFSYVSFGAGAPAAADRLVLTGQEWIVSEIAGSMLNTAAFAGHFEPGDPFQVRDAGRDASGASRFKVTRRVEQYTVTAANLWAPEAYVRMARSLMADGAGLTVTEDPVQDRVDLAGALARPTPVAVKEHSARLSRLLYDHPRSAMLHERAAFLLGVGAQQGLGGPAAADPRPIMCRMTAHLAIARALHPGGATREGRLAQKMLLEMAATVRDADIPPTNGDRPQSWIIEP